MKRLHRTLLGMSLAAVAAASHAASVTVKFDDPLFNGSPAPFYDSVKIHFPRESKPGLDNAEILVGRLQGTVTSFEGVAPSIFVDSLSDLFLYRYDIDDSVVAGQSVAYTINLSGASARTLDFLGAVNSVLNPSDHYAWLHPTTAFQAAAIQLGIWESRYESTGWNIHNGDFKANKLDDATSTALANFFAAIPNAATLNSIYTMTLQVRGADMITGDPPDVDAAAVPEPGSLALFGAAAFALTAARRRRMHS